MLGGETVYDNIFVVNLVKLVPHMLNWSEIARWELQMGENSIKSQVAGKLLSIGSTLKYFNS